jgi:DNA-binding transcriptional LysR family regulator
MDITLLKTFLEVTSSGSFVASADRLFVTQQAVLGAFSGLKTRSASRCLRGYGQGPN